MTRKKVIIIAAALALVLIGLWVVFKPDHVAEIDSFAECAKAGYPVTDTNPPTCNDGRQTYVGPLAKATPDFVSQETLDFQVLVEGDSQGSYPAKNQLITSQAAWQAFWVAVHKGLPAVPPLIPVDFSKQDVIALTMGPEPTDGYSIRMLSLSSSGSAAQANVQLRVPQPGCKLPTKATGPYFMAQVPKITGSLKFSVDTVAHSCG